MKKVEIRFIDGVFYLITDDGIYEYEYDYQGLPFEIEELIEKYFGVHITQKDD